MSTRLSKTPKLTICRGCDIERETSTLQDGLCPFCQDDPAINKPPVPETPKKQKYKRKTSVKVGEPPSQPTKMAQVITEVVDEIPYVPPQYIAPKDPMQELVGRELCRRHLLPFIQRFRPKYMAGWVHEDICRRLERFKQAVERGESPRLLLMCPPRMGKSEIGSRHFPPWVLGDHPEWEIIAASHTSSLTLSFSRYIRDLMLDAAYTAVFSDTRLDPQSRSVENWNTVKGGGYLAAGVGTGITGRGAHILLLDDLVKDIEAADSPVIKDNTWEWYGSTAYTRLAPGGGVLGIMTWWSEDDWAGRIQEVMKSGEGDVFEVVRYPAINEEGDEYILLKEPGEPIVQIAIGEKIPEGARLTRPHNTAIHPARYNTDAMLRIKRNLIATGQKRVWQALYQQNPTPDDGLFFTKEMFRYYGTPPHSRVCNVYQAWDFAISEGKESDYTVGTCIYQDSKDNVYVIDVRRFRSDDSIAIVDTILDFYVEHNALPIIGFEDGQIWKAMEAFFLRRCSERGIYPTFEILKPLTDKMVRAAPLRGRMQAGKVYFDKTAPWYNQLEHELTRFPAGKHDDQVDSLAWAIRLSLIFTKPKEEDNAPKFKSWRDKLKLKSHGGVSHMAA